MLEVVADVGLPSPAACEALGAEQQDGFEGMVQDHGGGGDSEEIAADVVAQAAVCSYEVEAAVDALLALECSAVANSALQA